MKFVPTCLQIALLTGTVKVSAFFKTSIILGSQVVFFSGVNIIMPLVGAFGGLKQSFIVFIIRLAVRFVVFGFTGLYIFAYHIPGFFAAAYWSARHWSICLLLPAVCMLLFVLHPIGFYAFPYALYWLIPIVLFFIPCSNIFFKAIGSTFIAHAVGSVIWLYTVPMTSAMWLSLIPVVIIERLLFASGMVLIYSVVQAIINQVHYFASQLKIRYSTSWK